MMLPVFEAICGATSTTSSMGVILTERRKAPLRSRDVQTADRAGDHEALDLRRAFEDRVDLRVAVPLLDGVVLHVAGPAEDLDRLFGGLHRDLTGVELAHRALARDERFAVRSHPA